MVINAPPNSTLQTMPGTMPAETTMRERRSHIVLVESEADKYMNDLLRELYNGKYDALRAMVVRDVYELMEKLVDRCHDAGNVVMQIVLKNS